MGVNKGCRITVTFRTDVYKFLFGSKGADYQHGSGRVYNLEDFDTSFFPKDWYKVCDRLGDGCQVEFPVRLLSRVKWAETVYFRETDADQIVPKQKRFKEVLTAWILKKRT